MQRESKMQREKASINVVQTIVVGVGLLGGSTGLAAKKAGVGGKLIGLGRSEAKLRRAVELGALDAWATEWNAALDFGSVNRADETTQIIFAAPVESNLRALDEFRRVAAAPRFANRRFLISDVGSVKTGFARRAAELNASERLIERFGVVAAHPIAGSDKSGVEFASADLFRGKLTILTPWTTERERLDALKTGAAVPFAADSNVAENSLNRRGENVLTDKISRCVDGTNGSNVAAVRDFWRSLGSRVVETSAEEHDRILARTSHLPNLVSALTTSVVPLDEFPFAGTGFRDVSRLAGGNPDVWTEIFSANRVATLEALERLEEKIVLWKSFLKEDDRNSIFTFLQETKKKRDALGS